LAALPLFNPASDIADGLVSASSQYNFLPGVLQLTELCGAKIPHIKNGV
jgi:hypothetical protein